MGTSASEILPDVLFCGNFSSAQDSTFLHENKIRVIVNLSQTKHDDDKREKNIEYHYFDVADWHDNDIKQYFGKIYEIVDGAEKKGLVTLIHCQAGISRSTTCCISVLMKRNNWKLKKSLEYMREKRECTEPNDGFLVQLKQYEKELNIEN